MPTRLLRWIRSKLTASTARTPNSNVPLAAQSRLLPVPYSVAGEHDQRHVFFADTPWPRRRCSSLAVGQVARDAPFGARSQRLRMRMLANVPRVITRSLPRREP